MHPHVFFLLLSSGVSSYFLPLKQMPHLLNETEYSLIDEMLCLLETENEPINEKFFRPLHIKKLSCAHSNTEIFIHELKKIPTWMCMRKVEKGMQRLEKICYILKKSSSNDKRCLEKAKTNFSQFKESLKEFLGWVNEKDCSSVGRSKSGKECEASHITRVLWYKDICMCGDCTKATENPTLTHRRGDPAQPPGGWKRQFYVL